MNLLEMLLNNQGGESVKQMGKAVGLGETDTKNILERVLPAVTRGLKNNASSESGLESLMSALNRGSHQRYLEQPETLRKPESILEGNAILGHIFGSKDVSRNVASHAAKQTGQDTGIIKKLLPMVAAAAMGALSKQTNGGTAPSASMSGSQNDSPLGLLGSFLDADNDGDVMDDILGMAKRFF